MATATDIDFEISQRPDFALLTVRLQPGQRVMAEPSAMVSMSRGVKLVSGFKGGVMGSISRALGGESMITNTFSVENEPGEVLFAAGAMGDTIHHHMTGGSFYLQRGAYMANTDGIDVSASWQGAKGFFSGQGLILLKATGYGDIFFNSYGAVMELHVTDELIVDTGYVVAFEDTVQYQVTVLPGLRASSMIKSFFFGAEGLVCRFSGQGRVWVQTRSLSPFLSWVNPFRPVQNNG